MGKRGPKSQADLSVTPPEAEASYIPPPKELAAPARVLWQSIVREQPESRFKWPKAGEWINYDPQVIIGPGGYRPADREETILAEYLRDKFRRITTEYRIRWPMPSMGYLAQTMSTGRCLGEFMPAGAKVVIDAGVPPVSGDIVYVQLSEQAEAMFNRYASQGKAEYHPSGRGSLKIYCRIDGREVLMNAWQATTLGDNRIVGVARHVEIDGRPAYVSVN